MTSDTDHPRVAVPYLRRGGCEDYQFAFHAVLIVDDDGSRANYNWSYMSQGFVPVTTAGLFLSVECVPRKDFIQELS